MEDFRKELSIEEMQEIIEKRNEIAKTLKEINKLLEKIDRFDITLELRATEKKISYYKTNYCYEIKATTRSKDIWF